MTRRSSHSTTEDVVSFGSFRLNMAERWIEKDGARLDIAARALDVLIELVEQAGSVVSKTELLSKLWPGSSADEGRLRVYITGVRKALGDGEGGARYVATVSGQGYCFVAPIVPSRDHKKSPAEPALTSIHKLPPQQTRVLGRDQVVSNLRDRLIAERFITVVGSGGIGKTTVAISVGHALRDQFAGEIHFFDLGALHDAALAANLVASAFDVSGRAEDQLDGLVAFLSDKRLLLILDCCEHVVETIAVLAERIYRQAPEVYLLATSRESLRVEGEHVFRLPPLATPPDETVLTATDALTFPAIQLFVDRASASDGHFELNDDNAPLVSEICRKLDGIALAIELAASRASTYSVNETNSLLNSQFGLMWQGRRTALPRHHTLRATLDWSCNLLSDMERSILYRLSVFVGAFTLDAACHIGSLGEIEDALVVKAIESLVAKSLVTSTWPAVGPPNFRLLDTTRHYAASKLVENGEAESVTSRHVHYFSTFLQTTIDGSVFNHNKALALVSHVGNIRKALASSFSGTDDLISVELTFHATPLMLELSLYPECREWCQRGLNLLRRNGGEGSRELVLQEGLATSSLWTHGPANQIKAAIEHGLQLAEDLGDTERQIRFLIGLHIFFTRVGDFGSALAMAKRTAGLASSSGNRVASVIAEWVLGAAQHFAGDQLAALRHCEQGFQLEVDVETVPENVFGFDHRARANVIRARALWLCGKPEQAYEAAKSIIGDPSENAPPISRSVALLYTIPVFLWMGRFEEAAEPIELAIANARKYSFPRDHAVGLSLKGEFLIASGDTSSGVDVLREALSVLKAQGLHIATPGVACALAKGLAHLGQTNEALEIIEESLTRAETSYNDLWLPSLLRIRGEVILEAPSGDLAAGEDSLTRSIQSARRQSALGWELKSAISLARTWVRQGLLHEAGALLEEIYGQFAEGFETQDLVAARELLEISRHDRLAAGQN